MTAKVRIKAGPVEFEYEGETELGVADIKDLFTHIETLFKVPVLAEGGEPHGQDGAASHSDADNGSSPSAKGAAKLHVNSVAKALDAKTGPDLAIAAAATLQIIEGKDVFSRNELLDTMRKATKYYNKNMSGNLTKILNGLIGEELNQIAEGSYSLSAAKIKALEATLA
ncbi:hypothetical protein [uncultured Sphingomonas sp.]|uniref:hypothetical protein n=1 Tax=uncultured Sphingomonas sp. TaxID=158754 RepID=UPI0026332121|nr:hypothetical protein [uncultured Sphingomonas sp.]